MNTRPADYESAALPTELFQHTSMRSRLLTVLCLLLGRKSALPNFPPLATTSDLLITNQLLYQLSHSSTFILGRNKRLYLLYEFFIFRQEVFLLFSSPGQKSSCPPQTLPGQRKLLCPGNAPPHTKQPSYACPRPPGPAIRPPVPCCCAACAVATACPFTTREYVCPSASWPQAKMMLFACFTPAPS